jgi:hypothetical protein
LLGHLFKGILGVKSPLKTQKYDQNAEDRTSIKSKLKSPTLIPSQRRNMYPTQQTQNRKSARNHITDLPFSTKSSIYVQPKIFQYIGQLN